uniref:Uncharacterized protein n=1 Tax=Plectus sambesii TaxID=2011161 RepID=A0A914XS39_9BILA
MDACRRGADDPAKQLRLIVAISVADLRPPLPSAVVHQLASGGGRQHERTNQRDDHKAQSESAIAISLTSSKCTTNVALEGAATTDDWTFKYRHRTRLRSSKRRPTGQY